MKRQAKTKGNAGKSELLQKLSIPVFQTQQLRKPTVKLAKDLRRHLATENMLLPNTHMNRCATSLNTREI